LQLPQAQRNARFASQQGLEAMSCAAAQRADNVLAADRIEQSVILEFHRAAPNRESMHALSLTIPRRTQVFTVPSGLPRWLANSP